MKELKTKTDIIYTFDEKMNAKIAAARAEFKVYNSIVW